MAYFQCPRCGAVSANPTDLEESYCGRCHDWTGKGLEVLQAEMPHIVGRVRTGLLVEDGKTWVFIEHYSEDKTVLLARHRLQPEDAIWYATALAEAAKKGQEDQR